MLPDIVFPSSVLVLKFIFKLYIDQDVKWADLFRAICAFPLDIAFLSFSFAAAFVYRLPPSSAFSQKDTLGAFVMFLALAAVITAICKRTDRAVIAERYWKGAAMAFVNYGIALTLMVGTLVIGPALK